MKSRRVTLGLQGALLVVMAFSMGCGGSGEERIRVFIRSLLENADLTGLQPVHLYVKGESASPSNRLLPGESREMVSTGDGKQPVLIHVATASRSGATLDTANIEILGPFQDGDEVKVIFTWDGADLVGAFR